MWKGPLCGDKNELWNRHRSSLFATPYKLESLAIATSLAEIYASVTFPPDPDAVMVG
ncbi:MAG TPA: hypothetical protein VHY37_02025 [Tepidisphaeraceae bacterium]|nr:hypothetical protein [Tepidisphaeraceae bacterium]